jgi:hypothetical protein
MEADNLTTSGERRFMRKIILQGKIIANDFTGKINAIPGNNSKNNAIHFPPQLNQFAFSMH